MNTHKPGCFFLVVGPSGAGKDSLMDGAKHILPKQNYLFAKRTVTRPPGMVGEDYESCDPATFAQRKANGEFLTTWQAHGYEYGLPKELATEQAKGRHIVANGSRAMVADIAHAVQNLIVIHVTAPADLLAKRLAKRGRETEAEIRERLNRQITNFPDGVEVRTVVNDASLAQGIERFVDAVSVATQQTNL